MELFFFRLTLVFPLVFVRVKSLTFFVFLSSALSLLCKKKKKKKRKKNHKVPTLFQRRKVPNESCMSCPEREGRECGAPWWRPLATVGLWFQVRPWTHAARSWMAPRPPPETWGQGPATSIQTSWPPSLTPGEPRVSSVPWPSEPRDSQSCACHRCRLQKREIDDQSRASQTSSVVCSFCLSSAAVTLSRDGRGLSCLLLWSLRGPGCELDFIAGKWMGQVPAVARR